MARMSISLRNKQGIHFMQPISSKTPISAQKGLHVNFRVVRDGKHVHFTWKRTRLSFHAMNKLKNADLNSKKV